MDVFLIIWLVVGLLAIAGSLFMVGYDNSIEDKEELVFHVVMIAMLWPIGLGVAIIISPFYGIYQLGKLWGKKK